MHIVSPEPEPAPDYENPVAGADAKNDQLLNTVSILHRNFRHQDDFVDKKRLLLCIIEEYCRYSSVLIYHIKNIVLPPIQYNT